LDGRYESTASDYIILVEKLIFTQLPKIFIASYGTQISILKLQEQVTTLYPEPDESSTHSSNILFSNPISLYPPT
jgi:hypothetical protein